MAAAVLPTPPAEAGAEAAVRVVQTYYAAIAARDYRAAHALWPTGRSVSALRRGYARTAWVRLTPTPPFETEGGAGSIYATIPVRVMRA